MTSRIRRTGRALVAALTVGLLVALGGVVTSAGPAQAASLSGSSPAAGAVLSAAPGAVRLTFNTLVLLGTASVSVSGPGGSVTSGGLQVLGTNVTQGLRSGLGAGTYSVSWQIRGLLHSDSGSYSFTVAAASSGGGGGSTKPKPTKSAKPRPSTTSTPKPRKTPTPTPTTTPTPTDSATTTATPSDTTAALIPVSSPSPTRSYTVESSPDVQGVTSSGGMPSPPVIWGVLLLLAAGGWVFFRVRRTA